MRQDVSPQVPQTLAIWGALPAKEELAAISCSQLPRLCIRFVHTRQTPHLTHTQTPRITLRVQGAPTCSSRLRRRVGWLPPAPTDGLRPKCCRSWFPLPCLYLLCRPPDIAPLLPAPALPLYISRSRGYPGGLRVVREMLRRFESCTGEAQAVGEQYGVQVQSVPALPFSARQCRVNVGLVHHSPL